MLAARRRDDLAKRLAYLQSTVAADRSLTPRPIGAEIAALKWALELADAEIFRLSVPTEGPRPDVRAVGVIKHALTDSPYLPGTEPERFARVVVGRLRALDLLRDAS
jgi:hypothetical protein